MAATQEARAIGFNGTTHEGVASCVINSSPNVLPQSQEIDRSDLELSSLASAIIKKYGPEVIKTPGFKAVFSDRNEYSNASSEAGNHGNAAYSDSEFKHIFSKIPQQPAVEFVPFRKYKNFDDDWAWGSVSAFIPLDGSIPESQEERYILAYSRRKTDNAWVRTTVAAFEVSVKVGDETQKFIFVNMETYDPNSPTYPYVLKISQPYDNLAIVVANKKGEPVAAGVREGFHWGGGVDVVESRGRSDRGLLAAWSIKNPLG